MTNRLYYGDNLDVLREHIASESVDLIYLDPPFNSNASYNGIFRASIHRRHVRAETGATHKACEQGSLL